MRLLILAMSLSISIPAFAWSHDGACSRAEVRGGCRNVMTPQCQRWEDHCVGADNQFCTPECVFTQDVPFCSCNAVGFEQDDAFELFAGKGGGPAVCTRREDFGSCSDGSLCCKVIPSCADGSSCH